MVFYLDFMSDYNDLKVTNPSLSPENKFLLPGPANPVAITAGPTRQFGRLDALRQSFKNLTTCWVSTILTCSPELENTEPSFRLLCQLFLRAPGVD